ncbi:GumC family protein [Rhizobium sp. PAMB 3174]
MTRFLGSNPVFDPGMLSAGNPLSALWRRRVLFVSVFISVWAAVMVALFLIPSTYVASGMVAIVQPQSVFDVPSGDALNAGDPSDMESQVYISQSPAVLQRVLQIPEAKAAALAECRASTGFLGLKETDCGGFASGTSDAITYLQSRYSVSGSGRSRVIAASYSSPDPQTARIMADALVEAMLAQHREELARSRQMAIDSLTAQLKEINGEIERESATVQAFRNNNGLVSGAQATVSAERLTSILGQLSKAEADRSRAIGIMEAAKQGNIESVTLLTGDENSRSIADLKQQLATAEAEAQSAAAALGPRHPQLRALEIRADTLRSALRQELERISANAEKQLKVTEDIVNSLKAQLDTAKTGAADANSAETSIEDAVRQLALSKQRFDTLSVQKNRLEADSLSALGRLRLVSKAVLPTSRYFPKTTPFFAGGFALALVMAVVSALVCDNLAGGNRQTAIRQPIPAPAGDSLVEPPVVIRLPRLRLPDGDALARAGFALADPAMREALGALVEGIIGDDRADAPRMVTLLSAFPEEGRTLISLMLAIRASQLGHRVLVVDADLRPVQSARTQRVSAGPGLFETLTMDLEPDSTVRRTPQGPDVIGAGRGTADPDSVLEGFAIGPFVEAVGIYDLVLFDSPPLEQGIGAGLLARQADCALFCTTEKEAGSEETVALLQRLQGMGINVVAEIVTDAPISSLLDIAVGSDPKRGRELV